MTRIAIAVVLVALVVVALLRVDYGFYNPDRGVTAAGRDEVLKDPNERELLRFTLSAADIQRFRGTAPTLTQIARFYGTQDSLRCSVRRTLNSDDLTRADRPLRPGTLVTLCLN
ncbi:MAG: hypothetical protein M3P06_03000 [Acidobacteriota bacterium]|nr:hypothetical protein [Acidobacteriota bacterium]